MYPWEKISSWARSYLLAATEHLGLWADLVAPYEFRAGDSNTGWIRPYLLLARAGLEAAAHTIWLLDVPTKTFDEAIQRHVRLMHRDFGYHRDALLARGEDTSIVDARTAALEERAAGLPFPTSPRTRPPGYERIVRNAATVVGADENHWAYLWMAASGAAHGQNWFGIEGFDLLAKHEYEPGQYRTLALPYPAVITETISAACRAVQWGTLRWLTNGGHNPSVIAEAQAAVFNRMPKKDPSAQSSQRSTNGGD